jgi:hypothetical protein
MRDEGTHGTRQGWERGGRCARSLRSAREGAGEGKPARGGDGSRGDEEEQGDHDVHVNNALSSFRETGQNGREFLYPIPHGPLWVS